MITRKERDEAQGRAAAMIRAAGIRLRDDETSRVEIVDFGLGRLAIEGVQVLTMVETDRVAAKVLVLFPDQTEPEHWHPPVGADPGKQETLRVIDGTVRIYTPGPDTVRAGRIPAGKERVYGARHEHVLGPGHQITFAPGTPHWFQTDARGAVMYSISTCVRDGMDRFTDPEVRRETVVVDELPRTTSPMEAAP
jgi:D-lyxose ketol-isomerase